MPVLAIKHHLPARFPGMPILESKHNWYVAKVRPRQEKAFASDLMAMGIGYYLPVYPRVARHKGNGKRRISSLPLFPSHVAFECDTVPAGVLGSDRVYSIIHVHAQKEFKERLNALHQAHENGMELCLVDPEEIQAGAEARVIDGPCKGLSGKMVRRPSGIFVVLQVPGLGMAGIQADLGHLRISIEPGSNGLEEALCFE
jgi:hypothetical protein